MECSKEHYELISTYVEPLLQNLHEFIVGQKGPITRTILALLAVGQCGVNAETKKTHLGCGHILFIGPTGTGKTELCKRLALLVGGVHKRVQGTSDLLASDITGYEFPTLGAEEAFRFQAGPIFSNVCLVDEINRIPSKAVAAFLEGMAEGTVSHANKTHVLQNPFLCLATMNPSEQIGTNPLTEAVADRFMFADLMHEQTIEGQIKIVRRLERLIDNVDKEFEPITDLETVNYIRRFIYENVEITDEVVAYCARVCEAVNHPREYKLFAQERKMLEKTKFFLQDTPLNPRTTNFLVNAAKAQAAIRRGNYRNYVTIDDVRKVLPSVLRTKLSLITPTAANILVDEGGDAPYASLQSLVNGLIDQIMKGVPVA